MNVLITSAGQRVSLVKFFKKELQLMYPNNSLYTADLNPTLAPACHISDGFFSVPRVDSDIYISSLLKICIDNNIGLIIPTIDTELLVLSQNIDLFRENKINIVVSDSFFVESCRDKRLTNIFFQNSAIDIPRQFNRGNLSYPVFIKPCDGSLSKGIFIAYSVNDIKEEHLNNEKLMFMEYINNNEYDEFTVDCYYNKQSTLCCVVPRRRIVVRAGEVNKAVTKKNRIVELFKSNLKYIKGARGCLTIQVFYHKKSEKILGIEINPRFGGGYPLSYLAGANYPKWILKEYFLNQTIEFFDDWEEDLLMLRYDAEVLVHDYKR